MVPSMRQCIPRRWVALPVVSHHASICSFFAANGSPFLLCPTTQASASSSQRMGCPSCCVPPRKHLLLLRSEWVALPVVSHHASICSFFVANWSPFLLCPTTQASAPSSQRIPFRSRKGSSRSKTGIVVWSPGASG
jgi:hypothetical protein